VRRAGQQQPTRAAAGRWNSSQDGQRNITRSRSNIDILSACRHSFPMPGRSSRISPQAVRTGEPTRCSGDAVLLDLRRAGEHPEHPQPAEQPLDHGGAGGTFASTMSGFVLTGGAARPDWTDSESACSCAVPGTRTCADFVTRPFGLHTFTGALSRRKHDRFQYGCVSHLCQSSAFEPR
jgi:hypothetical protein